MKNWIFYGVDPIFVTNYVRELNYPFDLSNIDEHAAVWLHKDDVFHHTFAKIMVRITMSFNGHRKHGKTSTSSAALVNDLLPYYSKNVVITKGSEDIENFRKSFLTP